MLRLLYREHTLAFSIYGTCELPTLLMALGLVDRSLKNDWLNMATFLAFRMAYFAFCLYWMLQYREQVPYKCIIACLLLALHCKWFVGNVAYLQRRMREKKETAAGNKSAVQTASPEEERKKKLQ